MKNTSKISSGKNNRPAVHTANAAADSQSNNLDPFEHLGDDFDLFDMDSVDLLNDSYDHIYESDTYQYLMTAFEEQTKTLEESKARNELLENQNREMKNLLESPQMHFTRYYDEMLNDAIESALIKIYGIEYTDDNNWFPFQKLGENLCRNLYAGEFDTDKIKRVLVKHKFFTLMSKFPTKHAILSGYFIQKKVEELSADGKAEYWEIMVSKKGIRLIFNLLKIELYETKP